MSFKKLGIMLLSAVAMAALMSGCGSSNKEGNINLGSVAKVDEAICAQCHSTGIDTVAGTPIYQAYLATNHYNNNFSVVGCQDCHGGGAEHYGVGPMPYPNPDAAGKCWGCHKDHLSDVPGHFFNYTAASNAGRPAVFASLNYQNSCTSCHDPHLAENGVRNGDTSTVTMTTPAITLVAGQPKPTEHSDWAGSDHGDVNGVAFAHYDFKTMNNCNRCHTTTGFLNFVNSNYAYPVPAWGTATDKTKEVITCKACHTDYNFKNRVRNAPQVVAPYNAGKSPAKFPNVSATNLCISCHTGYESGESVKAVADYTNNSFVNSHYLAAAGLMYMKVGFINFTSLSAPIGATTYGKTLLPDSTSTPDGITGGVTSTHRKLGTTLINGDSHNPTFFVSGVLDGNGPCVTCHLNGTGVSSRSTSHTLGIDANAFTQVCANCHKTEGTTTLDGTNFKTVFLDPQSEVFQNALTLASTVLQNNWGIKYDRNAYPYFFDLTKDSTGKTAVKDWTRGTGNQTFGKKLMGACFNIHVLAKEPAAYVHARTYARRLIYDSIDFLDDGAMDLSTGATAQATMPTVYTKGATAYDTATSESMTYLLSYDRTSGAWKTPERP